MSYGFNLYFKQVKNKKEAFDIALKFVNICFNYSKEYLDNFTYHIPSKRTISEKKLTEMLEDHPKTKDIVWRFGKALDMADDNWLYEIFNFRFVYWEKEKLLAVLGEKFPQEAKDLMDVSIYFQNSTDQNYELSEWGTKIKVFNKIIRKFRRISKQKLLKITKERCDWLDESDDERILKNCEYYKLTAIYDGIYETLHLNNWLWDNEDDYFIRFSLCAIDSIEKKYKVLGELNMIKNELEDK